MDQWIFMVSLGHPGTTGDPSRMARVADAGVDTKTLRVALAGRDLANSEQWL